MGRQGSRGRRQEDRRRRGAHRARGPKAQIIDLLEALKRSVAAAPAAPRLRQAEAPASERAPAVVAKGPKKAEPRKEAEKTERKKKSAG